ncbi:MAG: DUF5615 family PIN-like protein [Chloroflexota bacterium]|nr:DUF5615 family PIN-like protein [Chloroflexota bacterium]
MSRFLLDANLSPRTALFLTATLRLDVVALTNLGLADLRDEEVIELAKRENRVIITFDLGFGKLYHRYERSRIGVIVLQLDHQSAASVNRALERFFADSASFAIALERSLVVIHDARVRVSTEPQGEEV